MPSLTPARSIAHPRIGFNGQLHEPAFAWQLLGNGHRAHNPPLMRFHRPDSRSPFDRGGRNAYAYCGGDPLNHVDPSGQVALGMLALSVGALAVGAATTTMAVLVDETHVKVVAGLVAAGTFALAAVAGARAIGWNRITPHGRQPRPAPPPPSYRSAVALDDLPGRQPSPAPSLPSYQSLVNLDDAPPPSYRWAMQHRDAGLQPARSGIAQARGGSVTGSAGTGSMRASNRRESTSQSQRDIRHGRVSTPHRRLREWLRAQRGEWL